MGFFFRIDERQGKFNTKDKVSKYEFYHNFMRSYPSYDIEKIRELSWREVNEMISCWKDSPPEYLMVERIGRMIGGATGQKNIDKLFGKTYIKDIPMTSERAEMIALSLGGRLKKIKSKDIKK